MNNLGTKHIFFRVNRLFCEQSGNLKKVVERQCFFDLLLIKLNSQHSAQETELAVV